MRVAFLVGLMLITSPKFYLDVGRNADHISLHYPTSVVKWNEVCVYSEGVMRRFGAPYPWWSKSCWQPFFRVEEYSLREGTETVWAILITTGDQGDPDRITVWSIPHTNVRPKGD